MYYVVDSVLYCTVAHEEQHIIFLYVDIYIYMCKKDNKTELERGVGSQELLDFSNPPNTNTLVFVCSSILLLKS